MPERSTRTTLAVGAVSAPIALYRTTSDKLPEIKFDSAGPNGGKLWRVPVAKAADAPPEDMPEDPLAEMPAGPESTHVLGVDGEAHPLPEPTPGEYGYILAEEGTGLEVAPEMIHRGVRGENGFVDLTEHLARIDESTKLEEMRVEGFIRDDLMDWLPHRIQGAYWIAPDGSGYTLALLRQAMMSQHAIAVVRWTKRTRQSLGVVVPTKDGLLLIEVAWFALTREPRPEAAQGYARMEVRDDHLAMAEELVAEMSAMPVLLDRLVDDAVEMKRALMQAVLDGEIPPMPETRRDDDLAAKLAESLA